MTTVAEENIARVRKGMDLVWNQSRWDLSPESYHDDIVVYSPTHPHPLHGRDGFYEMWNELHTGYPDLRFEVNDIFAEDDRVAVRFTMTGTNTGPLSGMAATGKPVIVKELAIFHYKEGRVKALWVMTDSMQIGRQLGFIPDGPPPPKPVIALMNGMNKLSKLFSRRGTKH